VACLLLRRPWGTVVLEENPCMVKLANSRIIMNPGCGPTPDKPGISVVNYEPGDSTSRFLPAQQCLRRRLALAPSRLCCAASSTRSSPKLDKSTLAHLTLRSMLGTGRSLRGRGVVRG
jgi:hypothetical protein